MILLLELDQRCGLILSHNLQFFFVMTATNVLQFGAYEFAGSNPPIEWIVLEDKQDQMLITSKYTIESRRFHNTQKWISWKNSDIRRWLNDEFLKAAFDEEEQKLIKMTELTTIAYEQKEIATEQCEKTVDQIFLLSLEEVEKYFPDDDSRRLKLSSSLLSVKERRLGASLPVTKEYCDW